MRSKPLFAMAMLALAGLAQGAEIQLGSLSLDWPAGYTVKSTQPPFQLTGPDGVKVLVTVLRPGAGTSPEARAQMAGKVEGLLAAQAQKAGKVALPLGRESLPDGTQLLFIGSQTGGLFRSGHFLQYALLAASGQIALLTFEGEGDASARHEKTRTLFLSAQWDGDQGTAAERAAFTERVAALFRAQSGSEDVVIAEPLTLKLGELQANLDRVYDFCRRNAEGCGAELERYVRTVRDTRARIQAPLARESVRAVVRTQAYLASSQQAARQAQTPEKVRDSELLPQPLVDGLVALPVVDTPDALRMLNRSDAQKLGLSPSQAHELGLANLRAALKPLAQQAKPVGVGGMGRLAGDVFTSSHLLFPADWAPLAQAQGGVLIVALPVTDQLLYSADASAAGLDALRALAAEVARQAPNRLSLQLLRWTPTGWEAVR